MTALARLGLVDVIANPRGRDFLDRHAENVGRWLTARGLRVNIGHDPRPTELAAYLRAEARLT